MLWPSITRRSIGTGQASNSRSISCARMRPLVETLQAAVVVQVDRRVAQLARQRVAMIVARALPLQVVHAKAVQQHEQSRRRSGQARTHREAFEQQRAAGVPKRHRNRQRVVGGGQVVAQHAVERGDDRLALRVGRLARVGCRQRRAKPAEQRLGAAAHHARDAAHRLVDQAREAARALVGRWRAGPGRCGRLAMRACIASTRLVRPATASVVRRAAPRRSAACRSGWVMGECDTDRPQTCGAARLLAVRISFALDRRRYA